MKTVTFTIRCVRETPTKTHVWEEQHTLKIPKGVGTYVAGKDLVEAKPHRLYVTAVHTHEHTHES